MPLMSSIVMRSIGHLPGAGMTPATTGEYRAMRSMHSYRNVSGGANDAVLAVDIDQPGLVFADLLLREEVVGQDDDEVALVHQAGGGAVDADDAAAGLALDGVGGEPRAVVYVEHSHL